jgi:hypothetical protein
MLNVLGQINQQYNTTNKGLPKIFINLSVFRENQIFQFIFNQPKNIKIYSAESLIHKRKGKEI